MPTRRPLRPPALATRHAPSGDDLLVTTPWPSVLDPCLAPVWSELLAEELARHAAGTPRASRRPTRSA